MNYYEMMYIVPSKYTEDEVKGIMQKVEGVLKKHGATVKRHEDGGKHKFAYPMNQVRHGNYVLVEFESEGAAPKLIENDVRLGMTNEVLRFIIAKLHKSLIGRALNLSAYVNPLQAKEEAAEGGAEAPTAVAAEAEPAKAEAAGSEA